MTDLVDGEAVWIDEVPREKDDFYPTPPEPTRALLTVEGDRLSEFDCIWEPAAGDGAMLREITQAGFKAVGSDLVDRGCGAQISSFYDFSARLAPAIVTNPPFQECNSGAWVQHAFDVLDLPYMALLLPLQWPGAAVRAGLWAKHPPARVYLMQWRIDFTGKGAPPMLNAWFVWDGCQSPNDTRFLMLSKAAAEGRGLGL
ncbi:MAG: hypothetical protein AAFY75_04160 [Pseudomonadota bacterium]